MKKILLLSLVLFSHFLWAQETCTKSMSNKDFKSQMKVIESAEFTETKVQLCKGIIKENCISVKQLKEMLAMISFEEKKVDVAVLAYEKVVDKENFRTIYLDFKHEPNIRAIEEQIQK